MIIMTINITGDACDDYGDNDNIDGDNCVNNNDNDNDN